MRLLTWFGAAILAMVMAESVAAGDERIRLPGIKGADDRAPVETDGYPWRAIGRVNNQLGGFCTGTLVGPRQVLTAKHCLWNRRTRRWLPPSALHFIAGYRRGDAMAHARVARFASSGAYDPGTGRTEEAEDWAILILEADLGAALGFLPTRPLDRAGLTGLASEGGTVTAAGYAQDKAHILTRHQGCRLLGFTPKQDLLLHDCDATHGDSGAPLLFYQNDRHHLIAIHVATTTNKKNGATLGLAVPATAFHNHISATPPDAHATPAP